MQKPERSSYSTTDFQSWRASSQLSISPRFQRRKVWGQAARSFLIDTLILGYPVPPIYLRIVKQRGKKLPVREVIDGQQRISAVLDYVDGDFPLSKNIESSYVGKRFDDLPTDIQDRISNYSFICEVFQGISDPEVLSIFGRLNTYSVRLNGQELRNGKFFGPFKQSAYSLAYSHLTFWRNNRIFSDLAVARMHEVELTSELMIGLLAGMQDKKKSIDSFYSRYDEVFSERRSLENKFRKVIDEINNVFDSGFEKTEFRRTPLFYSMFLALAHRMYGVPGVKLSGGGAKTLSAPERQKFADTIRSLSKVVADARADKPVGGHNTAFVSASLRQTDNLKPRETRLRTIYSRAFD